MENRPWASDWMTALQRTIPPSNTTRVDSSFAIKTFSAVVLAPLTHLSTYSKHGSGGQSSLSKGRQVCEALCTVTHTMISS